MKDYEAFGDRFDGVVGPSGPPGPPVSTYIQRSVTKRTRTL